jgi:hypothetical protein
MRKLFAALTKLTFADHFGFNGNVLGKYPNNRSTKDRFFVEKLRGSLFDLFSQSEKLLHTRAAFCSLRSREFIERGIADLTHENLVVVQHGKPESVSFLVMPLDFVTDQRHGQHSPQTGAGSPRLPQPTSQINGLTATLSRKLLTFFFALAVTVGVSVSAFGQSNIIGGGVWGDVKPRASYQGPGDIASGATAWGSCVRAYNAAYANGTNSLCDLVDSAAPTTAICTLRVKTNGLVDLTGGDSRDQMLCCNRRGLQCFKNLRSSREHWRIHPNYSGQSG